MFKGATHLGSDEKKQSRTKHFFTTIRNFREPAPERNHQN